MRTLTANTLAKVATPLGTEPIIVIKIDCGGIHYYADKDLSFAVKKILTFSGLQQQTKIGKMGTVSSASITMDDTDGSLKAIMDAYLMDGSPATIYHHYEGNLITDLTTLLDGRIEGPVIWDEGERTITFDISTYIRSSEVGFALDDDQISGQCEDVAGVAWPLVFGTVLNLKALQVVCHNMTVTTDFITRNMASFDVEDASIFQDNTIIDVVISGIIFRGKFDASLVKNRFYITKVNVPRVENLTFAVRPPGDVDENNPYVAWVGTGQIPSAVGHYFMMQSGNTIVINHVSKSDGNKLYFDQPMQDEAQSHFLADDTTMIQEVNFMIPENWASYYPAPKRNTDVTAISYFIDKGAPVMLLDANITDTYIVNLIPGSTILSVKAKRMVNGEEVLVPLPTSYYTKRETYTVGGQSVTAITLVHPLEDYPTLGWKNELYVSVTSPIGPNTSDIIKWIIENYTNLTQDAATFASVATDLIKYPSHFALFDNQDALQLVESIAWQARCGLVINSNSIKIRYLSKEPASDLTIAEAQIELKSIKLTTTATGDVVTRLIGKWNKSYDEDEDHQVVYSNNQNLFGLITQEYDFFIYNIESLVRKSVDFWGYRYSNIWRKIQGATFLRTLSLDVLDCLTCALADTSILGGTFKSVIEDLNHDADANSINLTAELPSKAGTIILDPNYWISDAGDVTPDNPGLYETEETEDIKLPAQGQFFEVKSDPADKEKQDEGEAPFPPVDDKLQPVVEAGNQQGNVPTPARMDHTHEHYLPSVFHHTAEQDSIGPNPPKENEWLWNYTLDSKNQPIKSVFTAPAMLCKLIEDIDAGDYGRVIQVDVSGVTHYTSFIAHNKGLVDKVTDNEVLVCKDPGGAYFFVEGGAVISAAGVSYYWASSIPTSGNTGIHAAWESMGTLRRFAGVCTFEAGWPTVGIVLMGNVLALLNMPAGKGAYVDWVYLGTVDITFEIDIITSALNFSGGNPTYATIIGLTGVEIGTCRITGDAFTLTVDSARARVHECIFSALKTGWDTTKKLHGLRIKIKTETSAPAVGAAAFGQFCTDVKVLSY